MNLQDQFAAYLKATGQRASDLPLPPMESDLGRQFLAYQRYIKSLETAPGVFPAAPDSKEEHDYWECQNGRYWEQMAREDRE